jgi:hypothetical protein
MMVGSIKTDGLRLLKAKPEDITIDLAACAVIVVDTHEAQMCRLSICRTVGTRRTAKREAPIRPIR